MKKLLLVAILFIGALTVQAQEYNNAVGVKFGRNYGLTFKHFFNSSAAGELILATWGNGFDVYGLYEFHKGISSAPGLQWYHGPGVHVGSWNNNYRYNGKNYGGFRLGVDYVLGLEYKFNGVPIALSLDIKPEITVIDYVGFWINGGLGAKFTF